MKFGKSVKAQRWAKDMSQQKLADSIKVSRQTINSIENGGDTSWSIVTLLRDKLDLDLNSLS